MPVSGAILGHNRQKHEGSARFIAIQLPQATRLWKTSLGRSV